MITNFDDSHAVVVTVVQEIHTEFLHEAPRNSKQYQIRHQLGYLSKRYIKNSIFNLFFNHHVSIPLNALHNTLKH